jgi:hypothetical protein
MVLRGMGEKSHTRKLRIGASAADGGRPRFDYVVDDVIKSMITENRLPGHR